MVKYLRLSLTDQCDLRCRYCRPHGEGREPAEAPLSREEVARLLAAFAQHGVTKVRLTGGEPLLRPDLEQLVRLAVHTPGIRTVGLTTNGVRLAARAAELAAAGLSRFNLSLDSLDRETYRGITGEDVLPDAQRGLEAARATGLPVKVNVVVLRGVNDHEAPAFAELAERTGVEVRFIELMPLGCGGDGWQERFVSSAEVRARLGELEPLPREEGSSAQRYRRPGGAAVLGFISPVSAPFCAACTRLRVTAAGKLRPCLRRALEVDLRPLLGEPDAAAHLGRVLQELAAQKPTADGAARSPVGASAMCSIGG